MPRSRHRARGGGTALLVVLILACSTTPGPSGPAPFRIVPRLEELEHRELTPGDLRVEPEGRTVEKNFVLSLYTWFHSRDYGSYRLEFPSEGGSTAVGHLLVPSGEGPHPTIVVFPILAGGHVVSEGLAKALVNRGFAVARLERPKLALEETRDPETPTRAMRAAVLDARRLVDWLVTRPEVDPERLGTAGVSLGAILATTLLGVDERVRAGVLLMAGGGIAEILYESAEKPVKAFRTALMEERGLENREAFLDEMRPFTEPVDPLTHAHWIDPRSVLLVSGRFDRVIPPDRTYALWEALDRPTWIRLPVGHYQFFPYFWWAVGRGADHLERALAQPNSTTVEFRDLHHSAEPYTSRSDLGAEVKQQLREDGGLQKAPALSE